MIHNKFSKLLIVLNIIIYFSNCQLKIPLKYFPYYKYNDSTPSTIFLGLVKQQLYANIDIGTPKRTIQIPLAFESNDFYIADLPKNDYESDRFNDLMFYNATSSSTYKGDEDDEHYYLDKNLDNMEPKKMLSYLNCHFENHLLQFHSLFPFIKFLFNMIIII